MEYLSNEKVEEIAAELFRSYKENLDANWDVLCVEPLILAEMLGYKVTLLELGENSEILGLTVFRDMDVNLTDKFGKSHRLHLNKRSIVINESLKDSCFGRYKFTIAHELAHHIIDEMCNACYSVKYRKQPHFIMNKPQSLTADYDEYAANKLAAAILMPKEILEMVYKFCFNNKYIERINTVYDRENYHLFVSIAKLLGVSREALSIRLKDLGMLGEYRYMTVSEVIDVYVEDAA